MGSAGRLGLQTPEQIAAAGIRLIKMQIPLSIDPANIRNFARGLDEIVIVDQLGTRVQVFKFIVPKDE